MTTRPAPPGSPMEARWTSLASPTPAGRADRPYPAPASVPTLATPRRRPPPCSDEGRDDDVRDVRLVAVRENPHVAVLVGHVAVQHDGRLFRREIAGVRPGQLRIPCEHLDGRTEVEVPAPAVLVLPPPRCEDTPEWRRTTCDGESGDRQNETDDGARHRDIFRPLTCPVVSGCGLSYQSQAAAQRDASPDWPPTPGPDAPSPPGRRSGPPGTGASDAWSASTPSEVGPCAYALAVGVRPPSGTVTFLFTDVVGSTGLWEHAPEAMGEAIARHDGVVARGDRGARRVRVRDGG